MSSAGGFLLVRAGGRRVGLPVGQVLEVVEPGATYPVPAMEPAVRGVATVRGRVLPVVHLGALLSGGVCPGARGDTGILVSLGGRFLCLEVEEAESVLRGAGLPVPAGAGMPWASAVARDGEGLIPLLGLAALGARFLEAEHE